MTQQVAGFPYWEVAFNENGQPIQPEQAETLLADVLAQDITDLFIFAHGWNNARQWPVTSTPDSLLRCERCLTTAGWPDGGRRR